MTTKYSTREEWLVAAVEALRPMFSALTDETVPAVRVSVGWPGGNGRKNSVIGQCWSTKVAADEVSQVFISPVLDDAVRVLDVLAHELIHAIDDCTSGHKGRFAKIAKALGLEGKMTATVAGPGLKAELDQIAAELGEYPHAALVNPGQGADGPKKQGTRMLKVECEAGSGYKVRITRQWLDEYGAPKCPCHDEVMIEA
ncbi:SprT-like protease [Arthrobacter phage TforTroy]|uniref:SprT-like protease n=1 Tax=Arthrobacter phage TforTroy TaxID=3118973 RepID=A0ABZ2CLX6_9CAUD